MDNDQRSRLYSNTAEAMAGAPKNYQSRSGAF